MVGHSEEASLLPLPELSQLGDVETDMHTSENIFNPFSEPFRSEEHANQIAQFILTNKDRTDLHKQTITHGIFNQDLREKSDPRFFDTLYNLEAQARNLTPWTIEELLHIQATLYERGFIEADNLTGQRTEILDHVPRAYASPENSLQTIGEELCALELAASDYWPLAKIDLNLAIQYLDEVKQQFGERFYRIKVLQTLSHRRETNHFSKEVAEEGKKVFADYGEFRKGLLAQLPEQTQHQLLQAFAEADENVAQRAVERSATQIKEFIVDHLPTGLRNNPRISRLFGLRKNQKSES